MKYLKIFLALALPLMLVTVSGCKKDDDTTEPTTPDPFEKYTYIGEADANGSGLKVKIYANEKLFVGYNHILVAVYDSATGEQFTEAEIDFMPMMDMGSMKHSCPHEDPGTSMDDATKAYKGTVVFIMPSTAGTWYFDMMVMNKQTGKSGKATLTVDVVEKDESKLISFISKTDSAKLFVALVEPMNPEVGFNDFILAIYKKQTMMDFPPVDGLVIESEPWMPSMNHGSPNNEHPVSQGNGYYNGVVNFTMTGYWQVKLEFKDANGNLVMDKQAFDITF